MDALRVWQALARALPAPFLPHLTTPHDLLVAHSGVAEMAAELFEVLRPHLEAYPHVHVAGHSLGGALSSMLALTAHLKTAGRVGVQATTFGSPPVLALGRRGDEDGRAILQARRLRGCLLRLAGRLLLQGGG